jgi:hypothetical protein
MSLICKNLNSFFAQHQKIATKLRPSKLTAEATTFVTVEAMLNAGLNLYPFVSTKALSKQSETTKPVTSNFFLCKTC